jgi:serine/threonine protein kinase
MSNVVLKEVSRPELGIKPGDVIDKRFQVIRALDSDRVFLVCDPESPNRLFAMKISFREDIFDSEFNLRREFILHSYFEHPNIVNLVDAFETELYFGYLMEFIGGGDLHTRISQRKNLSVHEALELVRGILKGLAHVHSKGIIHGDVKPENILITSSSIPKITDFGVAREFSSLPLRDADIKGTPRYLCPEYAKSGELHTSVDVYAAGLLAFEILSGKVPLYDRDPIQMLTLRLQSSMPSLGEYIDSKAFSRIISAVDTAIDRNPLKRFQNAEEFLNALPEKCANIKNHKKNASSSTNEIHPGAISENTKTVSKTGKVIVFA